MLARPVIVEFLGLSGAGKSAVSREVARRLRRRGIPVREPTSMLTPPSRHRSLWKRTIKSVHVARALIGHPWTSWKLLKSMGLTHQQRLRVLLGMSFHWLLLSSLMRTRRPSLHVFDQGAYQALWSIGLEGRPGAIRRVGPKFCAAGPVPDLVVVVEAGAEVVAERLRRRGGNESRADRWDSAAVQRSLRTMDEVRGFLRSMSARPGGPRILRVTNGRDDDPRAIADPLVEEIERLAVGAVPDERLLAPTYTTT